ncbi:hypothetical protein BD626DRAFT_562728 [Schizophyllum amplum]|uniref:Uncharacterized protein n=1 Tax=Schizophyllum amplum TaxID=97359 RepID=A0A550CVU9_9AGAR|nr:hypothetical protein BD626DRAFT_562728 [Auriculariopsis ampla]
MRPTLRNTLDKVTNSRPAFHACRRALADAPAPAKNDVGISYRAATCVLHHPAHAIFASGPRLGPHHTHPCPPSS